jgi:aryl-alcohol dehydrogenase
LRATAAVLREHGGLPRLEAVEIGAVRPNEVLVELEAVGICRTDTEFGHFWPLPAVLGHEGVGIIRTAGEWVSYVSPGDRVLMTFNHCGTCRPCLQGSPGYCVRFDALNFSGARPDGSSALAAGGQPIHAHFLGQSSFATHAVATEQSIVKVPHDLPAEVLAPFGCGFQTGAGTVLNVLRPGPGSSIAVFGAGAVGLAAVAAAAAAGCAAIAVADLDPARLAEARLLGATHTVDASTADLVPAILESSPGGYDGSLDTTGVAAVLRAATEVLHTRGTCAVVGVGPSTEISLDWRTMLNGRTLTGVIAGGSLPRVFLPSLIELYASGRFPVDRLIEVLSFDDLPQAFDASRCGEIVKAVVKL